MLRRWLACGLAAMFLAVAGVAHASGAGEKPATVTLSVERAPLATVLKKIEAQTYYTFFFNNELVGKAAPVTLSVKQAPVPDVLAKTVRSPPPGGRVAPPRPLRRWFRASSGTMPDSPSRASA